MTASLCRVNYLTTRDLAAPWRIFPMAYLFANLFPRADGIFGIETKINFDREEHLIVVSRRTAKRRTEKKYCFSYYSKAVAVFSFANN